MAEARSENAARKATGSAAISGTPR